MNDARSEKASETYTISEIYALEDERFLYEGPLPDDSEPEEPRNDMGHLLDCSCPTCLPEMYDAAELEAGVPDRRYA